MALSEQEEFELLSLEREKAIAGRSRQPQMTQIEQNGPGSYSPTMADVAGRTAGLGVRAITKGVSAVPRLMADATSEVVNLGIEGANKLGANVDYRMQQPSAALDSALSRFLPAPENASERVASDVMEGVSGAGAISSTANALTQGAGAMAKPFYQMLAANPEMQIASAAGGAAAGGATRESGGGTLAQLAATVAGGLSPYGIRPVLSGIGDMAFDIGAVVGASTGNKAGINRLSKDAIARVAGDSYDDTARLLRANKGTEFVKGAKPTVAEALTEAQIGKPAQVGGAVIRLQKDLTGAVGIEDVLTSTMKQQKQALADAAADITAKTKPMREAALETAKNVRADQVQSAIDAIRQPPGLRASTIVNRSLNQIKLKIMKFTGKDGVIDPNDLYTIRKEIGNVIQKNAKDTANWDSRLSAKLQAGVQGAIDDAIEAGGGAGWKKYLETYSQGMKAIENHEARTKAMKLIAAGVKSGNAGQLAAGDAPKIPTLLHRPAMLANFVMKRFTDGAEGPVAKEVARLMQNPDEFVKLMDKPMADPMRKVAEDIIAKVSAAVAISGTEDKREGP